MKYYLKQGIDGFEFSPVGRKEALRPGYIIVDKLPQAILDQLPGGKNYVEPPSKVDLLEVRLKALEDATKAGP